MRTGFSVVCGLRWAACFFFLVKKIRLDSRGLPLVWWPHLRVFAIRRPDYCTEALFSPKNWRFAKHTITPGILRVPPIILLWETFYPYSVPLFFLQVIPPSAPRLLALRLSRQTFGVSPPLSLLSSSPCFSFLFFSSGCPFFLFFLFGGFLALFSARRRGALPPFPDLFIMKALLEF